MTWIIAKWAAVGLVIAGLLASTAIYRSKAGQAKAETETVKVQLMQAQNDLAIEKSSTKLAIDTAETATKETREVLNRCSLALDGIRAEQDRYRVVLRSCVTPEAVAQRMGAMFP